MFYNFIIHYFPFIFFLPFIESMEMLLNIWNYNLLKHSESGFWFICFFDFISFLFLLAKLFIHPYPVPLTICVSLPSAKYTSKVISLPDWRHILIGWKLCIFNKIDWVYERASMLLGVSAAVCVNCNANELISSHWLNQINLLGFAWSTELSKVYTCQ